MENKKATKGDSFKALDEVLNNQDMLEGPRALLLLQLCHWGNIFRPDEVAHYFKDLEKVHRSLPPEYMDNYKQLKEVFVVPKKKSSRKFAQEITNQVEEAVEGAKINISDCMKKLKYCEKRLRNRWWSTGKKTAWIALINAWSQFDREHTLRLLYKVPYRVCRDILNQLNEKSPLSAEEWDIPPRKYTIPVILEILEKNKSTLQLSLDMVKGISKCLLVDINVKTVYISEEKKMEQKRNKAFTKYLKLANLMNDKAPQTTEVMLESLFTAFATTDRFGIEWPERFTQIRQLINVWISFEKLHQDASSFISSEKIPGFLRDFVQTQWHAMTVPSQEKAAQAMDSLKAKCKEKDAVEEWFLVTLVRRGMGKEAMALAKASSHARELLPRMHRAWLCEQPESASSTITYKDLQDDVIGQFLWLGNTEKRIEFLREKTNNGKKILPAPICSLPNLSTVGIGSTSSDEDDLYRFYNRNELPKKQFKEYVRIRGHQNYLYDNIDPILLQVFITWDKKHPEEIDSLLTVMWQVMKPDDIRLSKDGLRNAIFKRCCTLFSVKPGLLQSMFIQWVKNKMVDKGLSVLDYNTEMTFHVELKETVPFLLSTLAAQNVQPLSPSHADEIIKYALENYTADEELIASAASIYASERGLDALRPPIKLRNPSLIKDWQIGVVEASEKQVIEYMITDRQ